MEDAAAKLATELGSAPPAEVAGLDSAALEALAAALREARRRQSAELAAASEEALGRLPWIVRGVVRRIVGA